MTNKKNTPLNSRDRRLRFSIRKFNVGVASVAVAAFFMVNGQTVAANDGTSQAGLSSNSQESPALVSSPQDEAQEGIHQTDPAPQEAPAYFSNKEMEAVAEDWEAFSENESSFNSSSTGSLQGAAGPSQDADPLESKPLAAPGDNATDNQGTWEIPNPEKTANSNLEEAAKQADLDPTNHLPLEGFAFDPNPDLQTSFILNLQGARGLETAEDVNVRHNKDYYITFSLPKNPEAPKLLHANLVSKSEGILETKLMAPEEIVTFEKLTAVHPHEYQMIYSTGNDGNQSLSVVYQGRPGPRVSIAYDRISPKAKDVVLAGVRVGLAGSTTQSTSYVVKATGELLAKYTRQGTMGDRFAAAGPVNFDNYELITEELPKNTTGILATDYQVGSKNAMSLKNVKRMYEIVKPDGTAVITIWHLNPDSPNVNELYDINDTRTDNLSDYILMFTSEPVAPGAFNTRAATYKETRTNQNGQTYTVTGETFDMSKMVPGSGLHGGFRVPPINIPSPRREQFRLGGGATLQFRLPNDVMKNEQHVTYYYAQRGDVRVAFVDPSGKEIKPSETLITHGASGTPFNTSSLRHQEIRDQEGQVYHYREILTPPPGQPLKPATGTDERLVEAITTETGLVKVNTIQELTYVYEKAGSVVIHYKNEDGQTIQPSVIDEDKVKPGTSYDTRDEGNKPETLTGSDGNQYHLLRHEGEETGRVESGKTKEITYIYTQAKGTVEITYENTSGETIKPTVVDTKNGKVGDRYDATQGDEKPEKLTGTDGKTYFFKEHKPGTAHPTGVIASGTQTVTYIYEEAGSVLIHYKNEEGSTIKPSVLDEDKVKPGTLYNTTDEGNKPGSLTGTNKKAYTLHRHEGEESGSVISGKTIEVTYIYRPLAERSTEEDAPQPDQKATTTFIDQRGNDKTELPEYKNVEVGKSEAPLTYSPTSSIDELKKKGYELVSNDYPTDGRFDTDPKVDQNFTVVVTPRIVPVTPEDPKKPTDPVDPEDPNTPVYPEPKDPETPYDKDSLVQEVNRTVTYVYEDGTTAAETKTDKVTFRREARVNLVTGDVTYTPWEAVDNDNTFDQIDSPVITGYTPDQVTVPEHANLQHDSEDIVEKVVYVKDGQKATVEVFVQSDKNDESTKSATPLETTELTGKSGDPIVYDKDTKLAELEKTGYEVIKNPTIDQTFDTDATVDQNFEIVVTPRIVPVTPEDPKNPGEPVDPDNPNTPVYPEPKVPETPYDKDSLVQEVNRTVTYVYEDGTTASETKTDKVTFRREARVNLVTGDVTYTPWEAANNDTTFDKIDSPAIVGYTPDQPSVPEHANLQHDSEDIVEKVVYVKDGQKAKVEVFVQTDKNDESTKSETPIETTELTGKSGDPIVYDKDTKLAELEKKGYEVIKNPTIDPTFDNDATKDQTFEIVVTPRIVPVTPEDPKTPGQPVDPDKPNTPVYPEPKDPETPYDKDSLIKEVNRTVTYVYEDGTTAAETKTDKVTFRREARVNLVTGDVTYTPWEAVDNDNTFDQIDSPIISGYIADKANVPTHADLTQDSPDVVENVVYKKLGSYVPVTPGGDQPWTPIPYPNHPTDPTKPGTPVIPIPVVPDHEPVNPLTPTDGGYEPPVLPEDPTKDTPIPYAQFEQRATTTFIDKRGDESTELPEYKNVEVGKSEAPLTYSPTNSIDELKKKGYELVSNDYPTDGRFDTDPKVDQNFTVVVTPRIVPVTLEDPKKPTDPVDPEDPNTPVYPEPKDPETPYDKDSLVQEVNRTVTYVYEDGTTAAETKTDKVTFRREARVNLVTGDVTYTPWEAVDNDSTFDQIDSPIISGYIADKANVPTHADLTQDSPDVVENVVYKKLGSYVPVTPGGDQPWTPIPYPNHPTDPTKPGTPVIPIPVVPDHEPVNPLTPTDGGYEPPVLPEDPTKDTPIPYAQFEQRATTTFIDKRGDESTELPEYKNVEVGKSEAPLTYSPTSSIDELKKKGYELVSNDYPIDARFDTDPKVDQNFTVVVTPRIVPVTPEDPKKPGQPVDPDKPNTPVYPEPKDPETPYDKDSLVQEVNRTVTYVYEDGTTAAETKTDKVTFRREAHVNLVTGDVTYTPWEAVNGDNTFDQIDSPIISGYIADKANVPTHADLTQDSPDVVENVVYKKLGAYVPVTPGGDQPWAPIPYPNHPTDPTKPGTPVTPIPQVPGHEPVNPLTPTDGGFVPPAIPEDPTKDTPIPYAQFEQRATTTFIDKRGDESTELPEYKNVEVGKSESPLTYSPTSSIDELKKKGYELVSNDYPTDGRFDTDPKVDQNFTVVVTPRIVPVTPEDPKKPTDPVDPEDPNTPVYPEPKNPETPYDKDSLLKEVNRTVTYVYEDGTTASETKTDKVTFRREARVNLVTGDVTYTPWEAVDNDSTFDQIDSPVITGYTPDQASVPEHANLQHDSEDIVEKVVYVKDAQKAKVEVFVQTDKTDESTKSATPLETTELTGKSGDPIVYDKDTKLAELEKKGYEVIKNPTIDPTFDNDATVDQNFEIVVTPRIVPVTPEDPKKPGEPVDPDNPNTPVFPDPKDPATPYDKDSLIKEVNRTVTYVYEDGTTASETKTDKVTFRREARVNLVTGDVTYTPWEAVDNDSTFDEIVSPTIAGYTPDQASVPEHANLQHDSEDIVEKVVYVKDGQKAKVEVFVQTDKTDESTKSATPLETTELTGKSGDPIVYDKDAKLAELEKTGYEVIKNPTIDPTFDNDATKDQNFEIVVTPRIVPVTPEDPKKPGEPVDPDKPNTPVYPEPKDPETPYDKDSLIKEVNRTVTYVYEDGTTASETKTDKVTFRREARVNLVTGDVTYTPWVAVNGDDTFDQIDSPIITGYIADKANVPTHADLTQDSPDVVEQVVYKKLGSYVPVTPKGDQPWTPIPYPNHPTDPTKPGTPVIPIPLVPDHEPVTPLTPTDGGYEPPVLPEDPTKDTPIPYKPIVKQGTVVVSYIDETGEAIKPSVVDTPTSPVGTDYDTSEYRIPTFTNEDGTRYVLVPAKVQGSETGKVVEGETKVTYVYAKVANWIPQIPGVPTEEQPKVPYPFDPTNTEKPVDPEQPVVPGGDKPVIPYVPGHSPVNPKDNTPLVPVDPADPTKGYIPPVPESPGVDTPVPYVPVPVTPEKPVVATPEVPVQPVTPQPAAPQPVAPKTAQTTLPNTGDDASATALAGTATLISAMTLFACRRRYDD